MCSDQAEGGAAGGGAADSTPATSILDQVPAPDPGVVDSARLRLRSHFAMSAGQHPGELPEPGGPPPGEPPDPGQLPDPGAGHAFPVTGILLVSAVTGAARDDNQPADGLDLGLRSSCSATCGSALICSRLIYWMRSCEQAWAGTSSPR